MSAVYYSRLEPEVLFAKVLRSRDNSKVFVFRAYATARMPGYNFWSSNDIPDVILEGMELKMVFEREVSPRLKLVK